MINDDELLNPEDREVLCDTMNGLFHFATSDAKADEKVWITKNEARLIIGFFLFCAKNTDYEQAVRQEQQD